MQKEFEITIRNQTLRGIIENPSAKKILILAHGFTGDWRGPDDLFVLLSKQLQQLNIAVLRFSFIGTPPSSGDFQSMTVQSETEDLRQVIQYARNLGYSNIGLLGESMGGAIVLNAYDPSINLVMFS